MKRDVDLDRAKRGIEEFLRGLGYDPDTDPELAATSTRVVDAWSRDLLAGEAIDVAAVLKNHSSPAGTGDKGVVALRNLATVAVCPHHLMPAIGTATVIYIPGERVAGLGAVARIVDAFARRLVLQEMIGKQVSRALVDHLGARGAICRLSMVHSCLVARGERKHDARVDTIALCGTVTLPGPDRDLAMAELHPC